MKKLALWASRYGSPYPVHSGPKFLGGMFALAFAVLFVSLMFSGAAFAADAAAASVPGDFVSNIASMYGPLCGLLVAVIVVFERLAKIIPNSTNNRVLKVLLVIATVLGVKVPDRQ